MNIEELIEKHERLADILWMIKGLRKRHQLHMDAAYGVWNVSTRSRKNKVISQHKAEISMMAIDRLTKYYNKNK